jgi:ABC-type glycerol-3-phosphate transport system substrate-binding protein
MRSLWSIFLFAGLIPLVSSLHAQQRPDTVIIWVITNNRECYETASAELNKKLDRYVKVKFRYVTWGEAFNVFKNSSNLETHIKKSGNKTPDLLEIPSTWAYHFYAEGFIASLPDTMKKYSPLYPELIWKSCKWKEIGIKDTSLMALPWFIDVRALYYRRDILKECGIPLDSLRTWSGFAWALETIKNKNITVKPLINKKGDEIVFPDSSRKEKVLPLALPLGVYSKYGLSSNEIHNIIAPYCWSNKVGNYPTSNESQYYNFDITGALAFYKKICSIIYPPFFSTGHFQWAFNLKRNGIYYYFFRGNYAMIFNGADLVPELKDIEGPDWANKFGIAPTPGSKTFCGGCLLGVFKKSPAFTPRQTVLRVLRILSSDEQFQASSSLKLFGIPSLSNAFHSLRGDSLLGPDFNNAFLNTNWETDPNCPEWFYYERNVFSFFSRYLE